MGRKTPYVERPPCSRCQGAGTVASYDHKRQKHMIDTCPACGGSGKR